MSGLNCYIFPDQASAQQAAYDIWDAIRLEVTDVNAQSGKPVTDITTAWAIPIQRVTDGKWWIPVCDQVQNTANWNVEILDPSWSAPPP